MDAAIQGGLKVLQLVRDPRALVLARIQAPKPPRVSGEAPSDHAVRLAGSQVTRLSDSTRSTEPGNAVVR